MVLQQGQRCRLGFKGSGLQNRVCTKHLSRIMRRWKGALGFQEPASRRSFVPACRPDQNGGLSSVFAWESSYCGGSGAGQHTETVVAPPVEEVGAGVNVQSNARDSGGISLWRHVHSVMQSDRLRGAWMRVSLTAFQLGVGLVHPAPAVMHEQRRYPYGTAPFF